MRALRVEFVDLVVDAFLVVDSLAFGVLRYPTLLVLAISAIYFRAYFRIRRIKSSFVREHLMPVSAGLRSLALESLLDVSLRRRKERIRQAIYLLGYWNQTRRFTEEEKRLLQGLEDLQADPANDRTTDFFRNNLDQLVEIADRSDAGVQT